MSHQRSQLGVALHRVLGYGWWVAGRRTGTTPTLAELIDYGEVWASTYGIEEGIKAMYRMAYDDIKDTIRQSEGQVIPMTRDTNHEPSRLDAYDFELDDLLARTLTRREHRAVAARLMGYTRLECIAMGIKSPSYHWHRALDKLREVYS